MLFRSERIEPVMSVCNLHLFYVFRVGVGKQEHTANYYTCAAVYTVAEYRIGIQLAFPSPHRVNRAVNVRLAAKQHNFYLHK